MPADAVVRARIDRGTKDRAADALRAMGLSMSDAIRLLLVRVAEERRLPFAVELPNSLTVQAIQELEEGRGKPFADAEELFEDVGI